MMKHKLIFGIAVVCLLAAAVVYLGLGPRLAPVVVHASSGGSFDPSVALENTNSGSTGGMAQYGAAEQTSTSLSSTQQAVTNWNTYIGDRADWYLPSSDVTTIADADWNARQTGSPKITAGQLASAANQLIANTLAQMSASQQETLFNQYAFVSTPNGGDSTVASVGVSYTNWPDPNVSATQNSNGTWTVTVSANEFSSLKSFFQQHAPAMMSSGSNFYPGEAVIVFYSAATADLGYGGSFASSMSQIYGAMTGLYPGSYPFGESGYVSKRPLGTFLTQTNLNQLFSSLGF